METNDIKCISEKLEHLSTLSANVGSLYLNEDYSDVVFVVAGQKVPANKAILAVSSDYFRALLYGQLKESNQVSVEFTYFYISKIMMDNKFKDAIVLPRIEVRPFKMLLKYIHTGIMDPVSNEDDLMDIIWMAHMYQLGELETSLSGALCSSLTIENVVGFMNMAQMRTMDVVFKNCCTFMDIHSTEILGHESFLSLFPECLEILLSRTLFYESEILIFRRVLEWYNLNREKVNDWPHLLRKCVRFSNISLEDHLKFVKPTQFLTAEEILDFMEMNQNELKLFRGKLQNNHKVFQINYGRSRTVTVTLEKDYPCFINNINFEHFVETEGWSCSGIGNAGYTVSVSCNGTCWKTIVDYQSFSWDISKEQNLFFEEQPVVHVKIKMADSLDLTVSFKNTFRWQLLSKEIYNILQNHRGVDLDKIKYMALKIRPDQKNPSSIIVLLKQPYMISKVKLLLRNRKHDNYYHYYIELSTNYSDWEMVCDKKTEEARSWQEITFPLRPVVLIKIVGTHSSVNNLFECANLQCYGEE